MTNVFRDNLFLHYKKYFQLRKTIYMGNALGVMPLYWAEVHFHVNAVDIFM